MRDQPLALPFDPAGIVLDRGRGLSLQLYQALRARVLDGRLSSGTRLPASRDLAKVLALSRNSVMRAYDQLYAEGYIETRVGDGTYVSRLPKLSTEVSTGLYPGLSTGLSTIVHKSTEDLSSNASSSVPLDRLKNHHLPMPRSGPPRAFRVGVPAFDLFPFDVWAKLHAGFWRNPDPARLGYGDPAGELQLRELIAAYLRQSRGISCTAGQIVITGGAQQAITLCAQLLVQPGQAVAVENPGYRAAGHAFAIAGGQVKGVPVDAEGLDCARLEQLLDCRVAYVTPAHQYPTGVTMSLARRLQLLAWAERSDGWIIEDDYDGEYRYSGAPLAPLAALDQQGRVLYVGTFGKIAFPALRLGYLVLPQSLVEPFSQARALAVRHGHALDGNQEFIGQGMANIVAGLSSAIPASGSFNRSAVNSAAGAQTPMSGVVAAFALMGLLVFVGPLARWLPLAVISGLLLLVAYGLVDRPEIARIWRHEPYERATLAITFLSTIALSLEWAILLGLLTAMVSARIKASRGH